MSSRGVQREPQLESFRDRKEFFMICFLRRNVSKKRFLVVVPMFAVICAVASMLVLRGRVQAADGPPNIPPMVTVSDPRRTAIMPCVTPTGKESNSLDPSPIAAISGSLFDAQRADANWVSLHPTEQRDATLYDWTTVGSTVQNKGSPAGELSGCYMYKENVCVPPVVDDSRLGPPSPDYQDQICSCQLVSVRTDPNQKECPRLDVLDNRPIPHILPNGKIEGLSTGERKKLQCKFIQLPSPGTIEQQEPLAVKFFAHFGLERLARDAYAQMKRTIKPRIGVDDIVYFNIKGGRLVWLSIPKGEHSKRAAVSFEIKPSVDKNRLELENIQVGIKKSI